MLGLGVLLTACGSDEEALLKYAKARKIPDNRAAAFMACNSEMKRYKPVFASPKGNLVMTSVPWDICACQSKTMTTVFEEEHYQAISAFATYMALETKKRPPRFDKKVMKPKLKTTDVAKRLETAFNTCVSAYKDGEQGEERRTLRTPAAQGTREEEGRRAPRRRRDG